MHWFWSLPPKLRRDWLKPSKSTRPWGGTTEVSFTRQVWAQSSGHEPATLLFPRDLRLTGLPLQPSVSLTGLLTRFSKQQKISTFHNTSVPEHPDPTDTPFWGDQQTQEALEGVLEGEELGRLSMGEGHTQPQPHGGWWFSTKAAMDVSASPLMIWGPPMATGHFTGPGPHLPGFTG